MTSDYSEGMEAGKGAGFPSPSDDVSLAVGFNPRRPGLPPASRQRRLNSTVADATRKRSAPFRGLNPPATINLSLRDKRILSGAAACAMILFGWFCLFPIAQSAQQAPPQRPPQPRPARKQVLAWGDVRYGFQHDSVSHALATIERLGRESGLYDTYIRTDSQLITKQPIMLGGRPGNAKNLNYFDAIFFFGLREIELSDQQKADLMSFIKEDGKGFVGAHTATTAFFSWPEFGEMIGARFDEHPWNVIDGTVVIDDPLFPAMKHFPGVSVIKDEHYQHKDFSRDKIHVLAHLDVSKLDMKNPRVHRTDGDYPVAWSKTYGKGRVFYATLGHAPESWDNPQIQKMYFEALKWAMGLSEGGAKPLGGK